MKIVARPIQMVAWFKEDGTPNPVRFKIVNSDETYNVIIINKILACQKEKLAGNNMLVFRCQSVINRIERTFEIKYELSTCKWVLWKI